MSKMIRILKTVNKGKTLTEPKNIDHIEHGL